MLLMLEITLLCIIYGSMERTDEINNNKSYLFGRILFGRIRILGEIERKNERERERSLSWIHIMMWKVKISVSDHARIQNIFPGGWV